MVQTIISFTIVVAALIYLLYYFVARYKKKHCGSCGQCSVTKAVSGGAQKETIISVSLTAVKKYQNKI